MNSGEGYRTLPDSEILFLYIFDSFGDVVLVRKKRNGGQAI